MKLNKILNGFNKLYLKLERHLAECETISTTLVNQRAAIHMQMDANYQEKRETCKIMERLAPLCSSDIVGVEDTVED